MYRKAKILDTHHKFKLLFGAGLDFFTRIICSFFVRCFIAGGKTLGNEPSHDEAKIVTSPIKKAPRRQEIQNENDAVERARERKSATAAAAAVYLYLLLLHATC